MRLVSGGIIIINVGVNAQYTTARDESVCFQNGSFPLCSFSETQHKLYCTGGVVDIKVLNKLLYNIQKDDIDIYKIYSRVVTPHHTALYLQSNEKEGDARSPSHSVHCDATSEVVYYTKQS